MYMAIFRLDSILFQDHIVGLNAMKKYPVNLIRFSLTAQVKQNNGNVCSSPKINCWSSVLWMCFALKRGANENREKPWAIIWWSFYEKDHCHSPVLTTPTFHCFQTNLKFVNVNCVSQLINSLSQLFTLRPRWFKVLQTLLFWHQATPAVAFIT